MSTTESDQADAMEEDIQEEQKIMEDEDGEYYTDDQYEEEEVGDYVFEDNEDDPQ